MARNKFGLRKLFYTRKYKRNLLHYLPLIFQSDGKSRYRHNHANSTDVTHLPLVINNKALYVSPSFQNTEKIITIHKTLYTVKQRRSNSSIVSHAEWTRVAAENDRDFLTKILSIVKSGCHDNKDFVNPGLVIECNYFLTQNKFKLRDHKFTDGDDEFTLYYSRSFVIQQPFVFHEELQSTFLADTLNTVELTFTSTTGVSTLPQDEEMYAELKCKLLCRPVSQQHQQHHPTAI